MPPISTSHVKDSPIQSPVSSRQATAKNIFVEVLVVAITGAVFAFAANQISSHGLVISRNYFPAKNNHMTSAATNTPTAALSPAQLLATQIKGNGFQLVDGDQAVKLFHDPRFKRNGIVFIDARDESHYQEGHIPGACEFDPYHPDKHLGTILPICRAAEQIVVYCNGGDCDDSETAAVLLRNVGVANQKLFIYAGGIAEWTNNSLPVETGARNSGNLRGTNK
jgi:rhodanese-related sulfurtransferase